MTVSPPSFSLRDRAGSRPAKYAPTVDEGGYITRGRRPHLNSSGVGADPDNDVFIDGLSEGAL